VYLNHVEPLKVQLSRTPGSFPLLRLKRDVKEIDQFVFDDFEISGYRPQATIKMQMAV
jgi:thymidylate synthase